MQQLKSQQPLLDSDINFITVTELQLVLTGVRGWSLPCAAQDMAHAPQLWAENRVPSQRSPLLHSNTISHNLRERAEAEHKAAVALSRHQRV